MLGGEDVGFFAKNVIKEKNVFNNTASRVKVSCSRPLHKSVPECDQLPCKADCSGVRLLGSALLIALNGAVNTYLQLMP